MSEGSSEPAPLVAVEVTESVARALYLPEWDENVRRGSPGCFKRNNTSVTRCKDMDLTSLIDRLKSDVERPGSPVIVRAVGNITVAKIKDVGANYQDPVHFEVWEKPTDNNPAHAEIYPYDSAAQAAPNKQVSKGLSRKLSNSLHLTLVTPAGQIEGENPPVET